MKLLLKMKCYYMHFIIDKLKIKTVTGFFFFPIKNDRKREFGANSGESLCVMSIRTDWALRSFKKRLFVMF